MYQYVLEKVDWKICMSVVTYKSKILEHLIENWEHELFHENLF